MKHNPTHRLILRHRTPAGEIRETAAQWPGGNLAVWMAKYADVIRGCTRVTQALGYAPMPFEAFVKSARGRVLKTWRAGVAA